MYYDTTIRTVDKTAAGMVKRVSMIALNFRAARIAAGKFTRVLMFQRE